MPIRVLVAVLLGFCAAARAARPERVGLYPLSLPDGQAQLEGRLAAQLHEGAAALPGVKAFDLVAHSACAPDEGECLGASAKLAGLQAMISARISATQHGYRWHLRAFALDGTLLGEERSELQGGPLDLAGALEHGVCALLGGAPCQGEIRIASDAGVAGTRLFIDGEDRGALPIEKPLTASVGRHLVKAGADERRVRVSYGRSAHLACRLRAGAPALLDEADLAPAAPRPQEGISLAGARSGAARVLLAAGAALLVGAAGAELYSRLESRALDSRYRSGALTEADASRYSAVERAGVLATVLAATGAGAIAAGGLVIALTPSGAALQGRF
jgi:hypothetical protein